MVSMIIRCTLWVVVIACMYYMSDQIVQLENRVEVLEAESAAMYEDIKTLNNALRLVIEFIGERLKFAA